MVVAVISWDWCCMPDSRKARRIADPGCSRNAHHWRGFVPCWATARYGVGYQTQLAPGGHVILDFDGILAIVALILWHYTRNRNLMMSRIAIFPNFT